MTINSLRAGCRALIAGWMLLALPSASSALSFGGRVSLRSVETGKCLEVTATAPRGSSPVATECRAENASQMFWLWGTPSGFHIQSAASGKCLDVGLAAWRHNPYLYDCHWGQPQRFRYWRGQVGVIEPAERPNECFDFGLKAWNVASPYLYSCWGGAPQQFTAIPWPERLTGQTGKGETPLNDTDPVGTADASLALPGGDLGVPVRHGNRTYFLFGDTELSRAQIEAAGCLNRYRPETYQPPGIDRKSVYLRNAVAYVNSESTARARFDGWLTNDCGFMREIIQDMNGWNGTVPLPPRNIPTSAVSIEGRLYVWYTTPFGSGDSFLAYADGDIAANNTAFTIKPGYRFPASSNFGMAAAAVSGDGYLYILGAPWFRTGGVKLARVPANRASVENLASYRYYQRKDGRTQWVQRESDASFLIGAAEKVGEGSLFWHQHERRWFFSYGRYTKDPNRGDLVYRSAPEPWGPWTEPSLLMSAQERPDGFFYAPYGLLQWQVPNWLKFIFTEWTTYDLYLGEHPLR